jgi:hypothetical protein
MSWRIKDWNVHFETHKTRQLKKLEWVPIPNKMDGDGYTELLDHPNGAAHFGAWIALIEIASKAEKRGDLARSGAGPALGGGDLAHPATLAHDFASLARVSRIPQEILREAIPRLVEINWLEVVKPSAFIDTAHSAGLSPENNGSPPENATFAPENDAEAPGVRARAKNGTERNGTEGNGNERNGTEDPAPPVSVPVPTVREKLEVIRPSSSQNPSGMQRANPGAVLSGHRISQMRTMLHEYMQAVNDTGPPTLCADPDDGIVLRCLTAVGDADLSEVGKYLRSLWGKGQRRGRPGGPKGYPWFETVLGLRYRTGAAFAREGQAAEVRT